MKRVALIAATVMALLSGIAVTALFFFDRGAAKLQAEAGDRSSHGANRLAVDAQGRPVSGQRLLRLVNELGKAQDRVIHGEEDGVADQYRLLSEITLMVRDFRAEDWGDYANVRASFVYVLSGGNAGVLRPYADSETADDADRMLARGIMAFAQGRMKEARKLLKAIDPRSLDVGLVGPFALARASLYSEQDADKALSFFDEARLASPHTAIEEAAVRREIPILINTGNTTRAMMLASDYMRRFGRSAYAGMLFRDFSEAIAKREELDNVEIVSGLSGATAGADGQVMSNLFLAMAGEAIVRGRISLAKAAADEVLKIGKATEDELDKARLYRAAAEAPSGRAVEAIKSLGEIAADRLSDDDAAIREAATSVARVVSDTPSISASNADQAAKANVPAAVLSVLKNADATLHQADLLISGNTK